MFSTPKKVFLFTLRKKFFFWYCRC